MKHLVLVAFMAATASPAVAGEFDGFVLGSAEDTARTRLAQFGSITVADGSDGNGNALQWLSAREYELEICKGRVQAVTKHLPIDAREWTRAVGEEMHRGNPLISTVNDDAQAISSITLSWPVWDTEKFEVYLISASGRVVRAGRRLYVTGQC